jgi:hypothetical protein
MPAYMSLKEKKDSFVSTQALEQLARLFERQTQILSKIPISTSVERIDLGIPLIQGVYSNAKAIILLARNNFGNEVYVVLRSLLERVITFFYLQACDKGELSKYIDYSRQKTYRKMEQTIKLRDKAVSLTFSGKPNLSSISELDQAVKRFTSSKGKPITHWSNTSIETKLDIIERETLIDTALLMLATLATYDDGSEALHATLYGCTFHLGAFKPGIKLESPEDICRQHHESLTMIFFLFGLLLNQLIEYISEKCTFTLLKEESHMLTKDSLRLMKEIVDKE